MKPTHSTSETHPWRHSLHLMSTAQREAHEEYSRQRIEAARAGQIAARLERVAVEVELSEAEPLPLDPDERDSALLAGLVSGTTCRRLVADD